MRSYQVVENNVDPPPKALMGLYLHFFRTPIQIDSGNPQPHTHIYVPVGLTYLNLYLFLLLFDGPLRSRLHCSFLFLIRLQLKCRITCSTFRTDD